MEAQTQEEQGHGIDSALGKKLMVELLKYL
jgi:hypothetical protein